MEITRLIIVAVGGQGNLLASRVLGEAALLANIPVRMSEIHGMAQRGGVVESAIIFGDAQSTIISDGQADILLGFEPSETLRALGRCHTGATVISNLAPLPPFTVAIGKGQYPDLSRMTEWVTARAGSFISLDATTLAQKAGNVMAVNMVLLGALIKAGNLPLSADQIKSAIQTRTRPAFAAINLAAFDLGFSAV